MSVVEKVQHEILEAPITVYNFEVEDYHTYYVAASADSDLFVLVHNRCGTSYELSMTINCEILDTKERTQATELLMVHMKMRWISS